MAPRTYGQALGELILRKRKSQGLTQTQLAVDAYDAAGKTRRISELETGLTANPHPKTIDPIISVLGITEAELEACAESAVWRPDEDLDRAYNEARKMIDRIAREFDLARPDATLTELDALLREKAKEWASLRQRIHELELPDKTLEHLRSEAGNALAAGDFEKVDALLSQAEGFQQTERTLVEIRKLSEIRIARADTHLLQGDDKQTLSLYISAAEYFLPFDSKITADTLDEIAWDLYEMSRRSYTPVYHIAAALLDRALEIREVQADIARRGTFHYRLGLIYRNKFEVARQSGQIADLELAVTHSRAAVRDFSNDTPTFQLVSAKTTLANSLADQGFRTRDLAKIEAAIDLLRDAKDMAGEVDDSAELLPVLANSLGSTMMRALDLSTRPVTIVQLDSAYEAFADAVRHSEKLANIETWSAAKINCGRILSERARLLEDDPRQAGFLRIQAIAAYLAANEATPDVAFPLRSGDVNLRLAGACLEHGLTLSGEMAEIYLVRAIAAYEAAAQVFTEEDHPRTWAEIQGRLGSIFAIHAENSEGDVLSGDIARAEIHYTSAIPIFERLQLKAAADACQSALSRVHDLAEDAMNETSIAADKVRRRPPTPSA